MPNRHRLASILVSPKKSLPDKLVTSADWPLCNAARNMTSAVLSNQDGETWDHLQWKRRLEVFGEDDSPTIVSDRHGNYDGFW
jgi:hypothetical protein